MIEVQKVKITISKDVSYYGTNYKADDTIEVHPHTAQWLRQNGAVANESPSETIPTEQTESTEQVEIGDVKKPTKKRTKQTEEDEKNK